MRTRTLSALAVTAFATTTLLVAAPGAAYAAEPKPVCFLLVDPAGDTNRLLPASPQLDIRSGDVATDATQVVAVLRVHSLVAGDTTASTGARWDMGFTVGGTSYTFTARRDAAGTWTSTFTRQVGSAAPVVVMIPATTFSLPGASIRWSVPRSAVPELPAVPAGDVLSGLSAATYGTPAEVAMDDAVSSRTYTDGYPSCLTR